MTPDDVAAQNAGQVVGLLLIAGASDQGWPAVVQSDEKGRGFVRPGAGELLVPDELFHQAGAAPAEFLRPRDAGPAAVVHSPLPGEVVLAALTQVVFRRRVLGLVGLKPGAGLLAKGFLLGGEFDVHYGERFRRREVERQGAARRWRVCRRGDACAALAGGLVPDALLIPFGAGRMPGPQALVPSRPKAGAAPRRCRSLVQISPNPASAAVVKWIASAARSGAAGGSARTRRSTSSSKGRDISIRLQMPASTSARNKRCNRPACERVRLLSRTCRCNTQANSGTQSAELDNPGCSRTTGRTRAASGSFRWHFATYAVSR